MSASLTLRSVSVHSLHPRKWLDLNLELVLSGFPRTLSELLDFVPWLLSLLPPKRTGKSGPPTILQLNVRYKPNLQGEDKYKLNKDVYTVEYIQEKESFQHKIVEKEDNKVSFEYFRNLLCKFPDHKLV